MSTPLRILVWMIAGLIAIIFVMAYLGANLPASAHSWYSAACCTGTAVGGDCEPVPRDAVTETAEGWWVRFDSPTQGRVNELVPFKSPKIHDSQDGFDHVCLTAPNVNAVEITQRIRCFYRRIGDS
jgi:hypothetical protein